ncbi:MAG: sulfotransferase domain-containing protein [Leptolyngbyaceae cyanobacterium MO_188.B28]|nr:sulfotransferase domain-containing protein [Leptolyngbyaceae cyanobacterium MO_188.B28]
MSIIWLVSYPKSGNTWLRTFLTNYLREDEQPADINSLIGMPIATNRHEFDELLGLASSDLRSDEIERYRPLIYNLLAADCRKPFFIKAHDAYTLNTDGQALFPRQATTGVIYGIRNPLDVAVSYAHHENKAIDDIIDHINCNAHTMLEKPDTLYSQLSQRLLSWSNHVCSWIDDSDLNVHVIKYEDMLQQPMATFANVIRFTGLTLDMARIRRSINFSCFECLQAQEATHGFAEKQSTALSFFRQGLSGSWREHLAHWQIQRIVDAHSQVMDRFGYLLEAQTFLGDFAYS